MNKRVVFYPANKLGYQGSHIASILIARKQRQKDGKSCEAHQRLQTLCPVTKTTIAENENQKAKSYLGKTALVEQMPNDG